MECPVVRLSAALRRFVGSLENLVVLKEASMSTRLAGAGRRFFRLAAWCGLCSPVLLQGCPTLTGLDPDLVLRALVTLGSESAVFALENLVRTF